MATVRPRHPWRKGFTLTELLVAIGILTVLVSVAVFSLAKVWGRSLDRVGEIHAWNVLRTVAASYLAMEGDWELTQRVWGEDCGSGRVVRVGEDTFAIAPPPKGVASCTLVFEQNSTRLWVRLTLESGQILQVSDEL